MDSWLIAAALNKFLLLLGTASVLGAWLLHQLRGHWSRALLLWLRVCSGVLLLACVLILPIQAGALAEAGWSGMFDRLMLSIVWQTHWGDSTALRLAGSLLAVYAVWFTTSRALLLAIASVLLVAAFALGGHLVEQPIWLRTLLLVHVAIGLAWLGCLFPFYLLVREQPSVKQARLLKRFGELATVPLVLLLIVGVILVLAVIATPEAMISTGYGQLLSTKLTLTLVLLALGAWHKFVAVPRLAGEAMAIDLKAIRVTVAIETLAGWILLAVLALMTTVVGPAHHG
ncbi:CopD family protein [Simiduia aestuariiviva]|uniref:Copper resistance protein D n=1 Tax=Simiduia aestuariiviva TaxID=1510459 RepID=A0A839UHB2_9GAMM|nr:CopD family protein [Simiduia aestuariiviva]MBB3167424.1 putative copper resistance protein D [Simiduia aestuariiviva]